MKHRAPISAAVLDVFSVDAHLLEAFLVPKIASLLRLILRSDYEQWARLLQTVTLPVLRVATLLSSDGQTPAVRALGLELAESQSQWSLYHPRVQRASSWSATASLRRRLLTFAVIQVVAPALYGAWKEWLVARRRELEKLLAVDGFKVTDKDRQPSHQERQQLRLALERQCQLAEVVIGTISRITPMLQLAAMLSCWSGLSNTPDLAMILTGLTFRSKSKATNEAMLHATYAHNRWLGETTLQTIKLLLLSGWSVRSRVWTPILQNAAIDPVVFLWRWVGRRIKHRTLAAIESRECPVCGGSPSTIAVRTNCDHVYCYACLFYHEQQQRDLNPRSNVPCRACGVGITRAVILGPVNTRASMAPRAGSA
jgi:Zinc finger, C3HC4 type (RING finger)